MKKKTEKKLSLKMIRVAQLNPIGAQYILGGGSGVGAPTVPTAPTGPISRPATTGPSGPPTASPDTCGTQTVACPHG